MYSGLTAPCERYYWKYYCTDYFVGFDINLNSNVWAAACIYLTSSLKIPLSDLGYLLPSTAFLTLTDVYFLK